MHQKVTARRMGGSIGATLPKDMVDRLHIREGDELTAIETADGILLTPYDPAFEDAIRAYQRGARIYRNALRDLARG